MNLNKVMIIGRLTADPELRSTTTGQSVTGFGVATNRYWKDKSGVRQEDTEFHNVVVWGRQAEVASQFLKKGSMVFIEGRLRTRSWQDKQGQTRKTTEVICERMQLGPQSATSSGAGFSRSQSDGGATPAPQNKAQSLSAEEIPIIDLEDTGGDIKEEDLPF
jgi:single-strand DNA-binding protein